MTRTGWWIVGGVAAAVGVTAGVVIYRRGHKGVLPAGPGGTTPDPNRSLPPGTQPGGFTLSPGPSSAPQTWRWLDKASNVRTANGIDDLRAKLLQEWGSRQVASSAQVLFPGESDWHMSSFRVFGGFDKFPSPDPSTWRIDPSSWSERVRRGEEPGPDMGPRLAPAPGSAPPAPPPTYDAPPPSYDAPPPPPPPGSDPIAEAKKRYEDARRLAEQGKKVYDQGKQVVDFLSTLGVRRR